MTPLEGRGTLLMNIRKSLAGIAAGSLALAGIAVASAPAAQATVTNVLSTAPLSCWVGINGASGFIGQVSTSPSNYPTGLAGHVSVAHTLTNATTGGQGSAVAVNYSISEGPRNGPAGVTGEVMIVTYAITTGASTQYYTGNPSAPFNVASGAYGPAASVSDSIPGSFFSTAGSYSIKVHNLNFYAAGDFDAALSVTGSTGISTYCNSNSANVDGPGVGNGTYDTYPTDNNALTNPVTTNIVGDALTVTGPSLAFTNASQGAAGYARGNYLSGSGQPANGEALVLSGASWPASLTTGWSATVSATGGSGAEAILASYSATCSASPSTNPCSVANGGSGATTGTETIQNVYGTTTAGGVFTGGIRRLNAASGFLTTGVRQLNIVNGSSSSATSITLLGVPTLTLTPASGAPGSPTTLSGSNWNTGRYHYAFAAKDNNFTGGILTGFSCPTTTAPTYNTVCGPYVPEDAAGGALTTGVNSGLNPGTSGGFVSTATGDIPAGVVVNVPATSLVSAFASPGIEVAQTSSATAVTWPNAISGQSKVSAFSNITTTCVAPNAEGNPNTNVTINNTYCQTQQNISATVNPGTLRQTAAGSQINLGAAVTTSTTAQTETGAINAITVTDARGGAATWTLTAAVTTGLATSGGATLANNLLSIGPSTCAAAAGSATGITQGSGGNFGTTQTICDATTNAVNPASGTKGGEWVANAGLTLTIPAYQAAGTYNGQITFTLT